MSDDNVTSLSIVRALKDADNRLWNPVDCLNDVIEEEKTNPSDKLIVIRIDTQNEKFAVGYHACQIKASEMLAALEVLKHKVLQEMGYAQDT